MASVKVLDVAGKAKGEVELDEAVFGITAYRIPGKTGIWVQPPGNIPEEKLAAIGVHISRWVTSHGFAFNVSTDLRYFDLIIPCGITDKGVTSMDILRPGSISMTDVEAAVAEAFCVVFDRQLLEPARAAAPISNL